MGTENSPQISIHLPFAFFPFMKSYLIESERLNGAKDNTLRVVASRGVCLSVRWAAALKGHESCSASCLIYGGTGQSKKLPVSKVQLSRTGCPRRCIRFLQCKCPINCCESVRHRGKMSCISSLPLRPPLVFRHLVLYYFAIFMMIKVSCML